MSFLLVSCLKELDGGLEPGRLDFRVSLESFSQSSTKAGEPVELKGGDVKMYLIPEVKEWSAPVTKGTIIEDASSVEGFFLYGFRYAEDHEWTGAGEERNLFHGEYVSRTAGGFVMEQPRLWAASGSGMDHRFFAFAASRTGDISGTGDNIVAGTSHRISLDKSDQYNGLPEIGYAVSCGEDVSSQEDLLYALSPEVQYTQGGSGTVNLAFSHALTAVKFSVEDFGVPAVIKGVTVRNVYRSGVFSYSGTAFSWSPSLQEDRSYTVSLDGSSEGVSVGRTGEEELTGGEATFLMIPQVCPEGSEVLIEFEHDGKQFALYADLEGQVWQMGKEVEYKVSLTDGTYHLDVSVPEVFTQKGVAETISNLFSVKAYLQYNGSVKQGLPWSVAGYSEDGGTTWTDVRPTWLTALTESGSGNYVSGDAVSGSVVADRDSYEALVRLHIDEHTSTYVDVLVEKQGEEPLTFTIVTGGNILWKCSNESYARTISYKKNNDDWIEITSTVLGVSIPVVEGDVIKFRGDNSAYGFGSTPNVSSSSGLYQNFVAGYNSFGISSGATFDVSGSLLSLLSDGKLSDFAFSSLFINNSGLLSAPDLYALGIVPKSCYSCIFSGCSSLVHSPDIFMNSESVLLPDSFRNAFEGCVNLVDVPDLPSLKVSANSYSRMFYGCKKIIYAPELPATSISAYCYFSMFEGCNSLTTAPELPATTLATGCYKSMFSGCTSLNSVSSELPATSLASNCYQSMFSGCMSLNSVPSELPATSLASNCYQSMFSDCTSLTTAPELPATTLAMSCYHSMFSGCTGLTSAPELPSTKLADNCYRGMFSGCKSLTSAPELPATSLANYCYYGMFRGCSNLVHPCVLDARIAITSCYFEMFRDCTSLTTAPELPATTLATSCYYSMFSGCKSLTSAPELPATTLANYCYYGMFEGCNSLSLAPELPATTLTTSCYKSMFKYCTSLTSAPELPATSLAESCYESMFLGCTSLTSAPNLSATTLASYCYSEMFLGCKSLTSAPSLPANTLASSCYKSMFESCTSLATAPELPATTLASSCYMQMFKSCTGLTSVPELPATTLATSCYYSMFYNCTGLVTVPDVLPANTLASSCYKSMFESCTSLTSAPELPATILATSCYESMFRDCYLLSSVKCLATDISASSCITVFLYKAGIYVSGTKTFYKNPAMSDWPVGDLGIPSGWTIVDATL